jgi:hypothetical protein
MTMTRNNVHGHLGHPRRPASQDAHQEVLEAVQRAGAAVPELRFPIDVTFPGEDEPDQVDAWISAYAEPFYIRA